MLLAVGKRPAVVLRALKAEVDLSDFVLAPVVDRSPQTIRRWRREEEPDIPDMAAAAFDDLRTIVAMLLEAGFTGSTIKDFLLSRNTGLGQDRPLDGIRVELGAFRRVQYVTECFIAGIAPEPGSALSEDEGEEFEPAVSDTPKEPDAPQRPIGVRR